MDLPPEEGQPRQAAKAWRPEQAILNERAERVPERRCDPPVPVRARAVWSDDGEEWVDTVALGWAGRLVYVQLLDTRWLAVHRGLAGRW